ncbi:MAG: sensor histidine kinase KdpD [Pseudomonas sp.]|nr:sensor histidine kinase KdpD [Pseudomonas sp.]
MSSADSSHTRGQPGRLKVFLGAAPGVGKTRAMLQAAQAELAQGIALRVALVEPPDAETAALLAILPQQPARRGTGQGAELDLDGLLADPPQLALIAGLAHANPPGSRHAKRWQDVQELLAAGIDVYTTLNVQHLESLNSQVVELTGLRVHETVPDWVVQEADELVLIDLPPGELLERRRTGQLKLPEQATDEVFSSLPRLTALRELALQFAATRVDADLQRCYRQSGQSAPTVLGRLLVGVDGNELAEHLVRHASRLAQRRQLSWSLVHVDTGAVLDETARRHLQAAQQLAENLGGEVVNLRATDVSTTLIQHAIERRANVLLIGPSRPWLLRPGFARGVVERLLRQGRGLEINILNTGGEPSPPAPLPRTGRLGDYLLAVLATLVATVAAWSVSHVLELPNISLVFLLAVLLVGVRSSLGPALLCSALSFLAYDLLFISPTLSLTIHHQEDILTLLFFLVMAVLTGNLAARQRRQMDALRETQAETAALLELSRRLGTVTERQAMLAAALQQFTNWHDLDFCLLGRDAEGVLQVEAGVSASLVDSERAAAEWAWRHDQPTGLGTHTLADGRWWWLPLSSRQGTLALLGVRAKQGGVVPAARRRLLTALGQPLAQALARAQLAQDLEAARLHAETEQLRSALLASVSHDLRTPLTVMHGAIDSLLTLGEQIGEADRRELLESTRNEAERLDRYIQNLLDMTRLGHGTLKLERDWVAPADIVASALQRLHPLLAPLQLETAVPDELPLLYVHAALVEQALINVLENAARFSPPAGRLRVAVERDGDELRIAVSDEGPGIPPAERDRIFDMFYTAARGDRGGKGTGLGLAICQGILGAHGGSVSVGDGLEGRGTTLTLRLPLLAQPQADEANRDG